MLSLLFPFEWQQPDFQLWFFWCGILFHEMFLTEKKHQRHLLQSYFKDEKTESQRGQIT